MTKQDIIDALNEYKRQANLSWYNRSPKLIITLQLLLKSKAVASLAPDAYLPLRATDQLDEACTLMGPTDDPALGALVDRLRTLISAPPSFRVLAPAPCPGATHSDRGAAASYSTILPPLQLHASDYVFPHNACDEDNANCRALIQQLCLADDAADTPEDRLHVSLLYGELFNRLTHHDPINVLLYHLHLHLHGMTSLIPLPRFLDKDLAPLTRALKYQRGCLVIQAKILLQIALHVRIPGRVRRTDNNLLVELQQNNHWRVFPLSYMPRRGDISMDLRDAGIAHSLSDIVLSNEAEVTALKAADRAKMSTSTPLVRGGISGFVPLRAALQSPPTDCTSPVTSESSQSPAPEEARSRAGSGKQPAEAIPATERLGFYH